MTLCCSRSGQQYEAMSDRHPGTSGGVLFSKSFQKQELSDRATQQFIDAHPEQPLLAYVLGESTDWLTQISERGTEADSDKYPLMASLNFVNCIAHAQSVTRRI